jgi:hypothetical protein
VPSFDVDEKIALKKWDDILDRPEYGSPIADQKFRSLRIVAVYSFKEQSAHCSISECQQVHSQGFLVSTSDEKETNLCESCGLRRLGMTIDQAKNDLRDQARMRKQRVRLNTILDQSDVIKGRIKKLKQTQKGANWLYQMSAMFRKTYPMDLIDALEELATNRNDNSIVAAIVENEADPSQLEQLQGLGIFAADIREELIGKILKPLIALEKLADNPGTNPALTRYCGWADSLDEQFAFAEHLVEEGRAFFDKENLQRLKSVPLSEASAGFMQSVRWKDGVVISKRK